MEELNTCAKLSDFLDSKLPPEVQPAPPIATPESPPIDQAAAIPAQSAATVTPATAQSFAANVSAPDAQSVTVARLESIVAQQAGQIAIIAQQLQRLTDNASPGILSPAAIPTPISTPTASVAPPAEEQKAAATLSTKNVESTEDYERTQTASQKPSQPPVPGAKLGRDPQGNPAWFIADPQRPGKYLRVAEEDNS
jgi:hypothetical protein